MDYSPYALLRYHLQLKRSYKIQNGYNRLKQPQEGIGKGLSPLLN